jgi:undecaprenyl-diphosphatase
LPITSSFPSGHTAAAIALYVGLAFLISSHVRSTFVRVAAWTIGVLIPIWVGLARIYRGMHHPSDVMASVVLGTAALLVAALAVRTAEAAAERRRAQHASTTAAAAEARR